MASQPPVPATRAIRRDAGIYGYESALRRAGLGPVAGVDEAGRGACAGPLVAAAVVLPEGPRGKVPGLADSKLLTPAARERVYAEVVRRAVAWSVVGIEAPECDRLGMHVADITALRRALARLPIAPAYLLSDGFGVDGTGVPNLAVWKGDRVAACVAAASVVAKVTRDAIMTAMHDRHPQYRFDIHKGYCTAEHQEALERHGPCPEHRRRFITVRRVEPADQVAARRVEPADQVAARRVELADQVAARRVEPADQVAARRVEPADQAAARRVVPGTGDAGDDGGVRELAAGAVRA